MNKTEAQRRLPKVIHLGEDMVSSGFDFSCAHPMMHVEAWESLGPWVHYESSSTLSPVLFPGAGKLSIRVWMRTEMSDSSGGRKVQTLGSSFSLLSGPLSLGRQHH